MNRPALWTLLWTGLAVAIPLVTLFGPALATDCSFAMRNAGHFYYPLFQWCCREWAAGRVPLWNPQENCGMPVLADATSSVFYPGKLLFVLPLDFAVLYKLYIVGHVVLAAVFSYLLARAWKAGHTAAALAAISYSCGGNVVFQYCNVVFLVGAAWLPLAALAADRMLRGRGWRWAMLLGVCLAMMILGGDPETAYHALFISAIYAVILSIRWDKTAPEVASPPTRVGSRLILICLAAAIAFLLAAVQILPSAEATRYSDRAAFDRPRNIYECATILLQRDAQQPLGETALQSMRRGLFGRPLRGSHHEQAFDFSVGPWRLTEYLWPNIAGRMFPTNRRWLSLLPAEARTWTPTLYLGLLPAVFAVTSLRFWTGSRRNRWLSWLVLIFTVASFGHYGLGWLANEIVGALKRGGEPASSFAPHVGGLYWLFATLLPTYIYFRYPAKLLPLVSLGISQLAAVGFDRAFAQRRPRLERFLLGLAIISLFGAVLVWLVGFNVLSRFAHFGDLTIGPFDAAGAHHDILLALGQTAVIAVIGRWLLRHAWEQPAHGQRWQLAAVLLTATEVAFANYWLIVTAPAELWRGEPPLAAEIKSSPRPGLATTAFSPRVFRGNLASWRPASFALTASTHRMVELAQWEGDTLFPKHELASGLSLVEAYGSIKLVDYSALFAVARQRGPRQPDGTYAPQPHVLRLLGTEYEVLPGSRGRAEKPEGAALWRVDPTLPRAWIVHGVEVLPPLARPLRIQQIHERTDAVLFPGGQIRDYLRSVTIETDAPPSQIWKSSVSDAIYKMDQCDIVSFDAQDVVIAAHLAAPGLVVLGDAWYPGWKAHVTSGERFGEAPIYRTQRVFRGIWLEAGQHTIEFRYEPQSFYLGAAISSTFWVLITVVALFASIRRGVSLRTKPPKLDTTPHSE